MLPPSTMLTCLSRASSETVRNATPQEQNEQQKTLPEPADAPPELATTLWNDKADSYDGDDSKRQPPETNLLQTDRNANSYKTRTLETLRFLARTTNAYSPTS